MGIFKKKKSACERNTQGMALYTLRHKWHLLRRMEDYDKIVNGACMFCFDARQSARSNNKVNYVEVACWFCRLNKKPYRNICHKGYGWYSKRMKLALKRGNEKLFWENYFRIVKLLEKLAYDL